MQKWKCRKQNAKQNDNSIVGVPALHRWVLGPSSLTVWRTFTFFSSGISSLPSSALSKRLKESAKQHLAFSINHTFNYNPFCPDRKNIFEKLTHDRSSHLTAIIYTLWIMDNRNRKHLRIVCRGESDKGGNIPGSS